MSPLPIDLDSESIQLENGWYTRDELARKIRAMLDSGEFAISRPSQALEELTTVLQSLQTLAFRVTPELADAITAEASRQGKTAASLVRDAVAKMLALPSSESSGRNNPSGNPEVPIVPEPISPGPVLKAAPLEPPPLRRAAVVESVPSVVVDPEVSSPVLEMKSSEPVSKRKEDEIEQRWFGS